MTALLTTREVAERLGLSPKTVSQNAKAGVYPFAIDVAARDAGRRHKATWRYDPDQLAAWLASRAQGDPWRAPKGARTR